jgi:hypothetical protein
VREALRLAAAELVAAGQVVGIVAADEDAAALADMSNVVVASAGALGDPDRVAHEVYGAVHTLDAAAVTVILARDFGQRGLAHAVRDRLTRAASGRVFAVDEPMDDDPWSIRMAALGAASEAAASLRAGRTAQGVRPAG